MARKIWTLRLRLNRKGRIQLCKSIVDVVKGREIHCGQAYEEVLIRGKRVAKKRCLSHSIHISPKPPAKGQRGRKAAAA